MIFDVFSAVVRFERRFRNINFGHRYQLDRFRYGFKNIYAYEIMARFFGEGKNYGFKFMVVTSQSDGWVTS